MLQATSDTAHAHVSSASSGGNEVENPETTFLKKFLPDVIKANGLTIHIETMTSHFEILRAHKASNIRASSAWIMFTVEKKTIRTKTIADRNAFLAWCQSPIKALFSRKKGEENFFGPPNVIFVQSPEFYTKN